VTYAPVTLSALGRYWKAQGGTLLGIVGDGDHASKGTSYHLGRSALKITAYSRRTARDKAGLTEAASAIDLGRLNGKIDDLRDFSAWLVRQCQSSAPGTRDIREVIYAGTYKGTTAVLRYDRERGATSAPKPGEADASHLSHTHVSFYRDSRSRDKIGLFRPYFEDMEDDMKLLNAGQLLRRLPAGTDLFDEPNGTKVGDLGDGTSATVVFRVVALDESKAWWLVDGGGSGGQMLWVKAV
jgi:hypothetical protein